jgi:hypothetical protein
MRQQFEGARFALGKVTITAGAVEALADAGEHAATFLAHHVRGDWGEAGHFDTIQLTADERRRGWEATDDGGKINKSNVLNQRDRAMSEYTTFRAKRVWVITCLDPDGRDHGAAARRILTTGGETRTTSTQWSRH